MRLLNLTLLPFNSTMVRLKVPLFPCCRITVLYFNSTMVRLKDILPLPTMKKSKEFQFHYGTIKSCGGSRTWTCITYFNSTMVRLKVLVPFLYRSCVSHFNSTMVRLKVTCRFSSETFALFQFHYGTIKRCSIWWNCCRASISIPLWYD